VRAQGLDHLKISKDPNRNRTLNLPSFGTSPHPTSPPVTTFNRVNIKFLPKEAIKAQRWKRDIGLLFL
jgi:hypothetical protein